MLNKPLTEPHCSTHKTLTQISAVITATKLSKGDVIAVNVSLTVLKLFNTESIDLYDSGVVEEMLSTFFFIETI